MRVSLTFRNVIERIEKSDGVGIDGLSGGNEARSEKNYWVNIEEVVVGAPNPPHQKNDGLVLQLRRLLAPKRLVETQNPINFLGDVGVPRVFLTFWRR